jgi:hypothetical protein
MLRGLAVWREADNDTLSKDLRHRAQRADRRLRSTARHKGDRDEKA